MEGQHWFGEEMFPSTVLLREAEIHLGEEDAEITWTPIYSIDGATQIALGGRTTSGSVFWTPGSNDQGGRIFFGIKFACSAAWSESQARVPFLHHMTVYGTYLPDVSDNLEFVIDIQATATRRRVSPKSVHDTLKGFRNAGAKTWTDPNGSTGYISIDSAEHGAPEKMAAMEGRDVMTLRGQLVEYA